MLQNDPLLLAYVCISIWGKFQHHSIDGLSGRCDRKFWKIFILLQITHSNMVQILLIFMEIKSSTSIIFDLKRNQSPGRWFSWILKIFLFLCEEENMKKIGQYLRANILCTAGTIIITFGMQGLEHNTYKFGRNRLSGLQDMIGRN